MIWAWIETSSADTGSSQTISRGRPRGPRDADALAAGRRRIRAGSGAGAGAQRPTVSSSSATRFARSRRFLAGGEDSAATPTMSPTVRRGLSEAYGSWNTICICRRKRVNARGRKRVNDRGHRNGFRHRRFDATAGCTARRRFAAAAFADQPERLSRARVANSRHPPRARDLRLRRAEAREDPAIGKYLAAMHRQQVSTRGSCRTQAHSALGTHLAERLARRCGSGSVTNLQRSAKRQPIGGLTRLGTVPGMASSGRRPCTLASTRGIERISPCV